MKKFILVLLFGAFLYANTINLPQEGGTGDVEGPASSVDNNIPVFDGATGKVLEDLNLFALDSAQEQMKCSSAASRCDISATNTDSVIDAYRTFRTGLASTVPEGVVSTQNPDASRGVYLGPLTGSASSFTGMVSLNGAGNRANLMNYVADTGLGFIGGGAQDVSFVRNDGGLPIYVTHTFMQNGSIWAQNSLAGSFADNSKYYVTDALDDDEYAWFGMDGLLQAPDATADAAQAPSWTIQASNKTAGTGLGGDIDVTGGSSTGNTGGAVAVVGGQSTKASGGIGGAASLTGGAATGATNASGGAAVVTGGEAANGNGQGGRVDIFGGNGAAIGGYISVYGGTGTSGAGGIVDILGGGGDQGADVSIGGGSSTGANPGGSIVLYGGTGSSEGFIQAQSNLIMDTAQSSSAQDDNTGAGSGTTFTVDWDTGNAQVIDLNDFSGNVTLTLSNPLTGASYGIKVVQQAVARNIIWPASVKWPGGTAPTISTTDNAIDLITLYYDGTNYLATFAQDFQ